MKQFAIAALSLTLSAGAWAQNQDPWSRLEAKLAGGETEVQLIFNVDNRITIEMSQTEIREATQIAQVFPDDDFPSRLSPESRLARVLCEQRFGEGAVRHQCFYGLVLPGGPAPRTRKDRVEQIIRRHARWIM